MARRTNPLGGGAKGRAGGLLLAAVRRTGISGTVLRDPRLNILDAPHLAHAQLIVGSRPVSAADDLLHTLTAEPAETPLDLGRSHQVSGHIEQHSHETTRHLTTPARAGQSGHVPSSNVTSPVVVSATTA